MQKAIIRLGSKCNSNCSFCHSRCIRDYNDLDIKNILAKIDSIPADVNCVLLSGGEPTIRKDFFKILDNITHRELEVGLISNARMLSNYKFSYKLAKYNLEQLFTSLHSHDKAINDTITGCLSFDQTIRGIDNAKNLDIWVLVNIVINNHNISNLKETVRFVLGLGVDMVKISFVEPIYDADMVHIPIIEDAAHTVKSILDDFQSNPIGWDGFPLCLMKGYEHKLSDLKSNNIRYISNVNESGFYPVDEGNKIKLLSCKNCQQINNCEGIYRLYHKNNAFVPSPY